MQNESHTTAQFISEFATGASLLFPNFLANDQRPPLLALFGIDSDICETFLNQHDAVHVACSLEQELLANLSHQIDTIPALAKNPATAHMATDIVGRLRSDLEAVADAIRVQSDQYENAYASFAPELARKVSSVDTVRNIDGILSPLIGWPHVQTMAGFHTLLADTLLLVQRLRLNSRKQAELFAARGQEIKTWYDMMNPGASVRYARMETGTDNLVLWAESFGVPLNAVACLSQCQLNCLGLSITFFAD